MAQPALEPLSAADASFLHQEGAATHMHIGGVARFDGPAPTYPELLEHVQSRLGLVPRYRRRLASPPAALGRPRWVDDPAFNLEYHVRHAALPAPGDDVTLRRLLARVFSLRLDRTKPLWELWLVEGLTRGRFALVSKTHHALVDGVAGADLLTILFDGPAGPPDAGAAIVPWVPQPAPTTAQLAADAVEGAARTALGVPLRALGAVGSPRRALRTAREAAAAVGEVAAAQLLRPAPPSPLNVPIGPHRRLAFADAPLRDFRAVKDAFGGTVNDVVLAVTAGGIRAWMHHRGMRTAGLELLACVPVSTRAPDERGAPGNRLTQVIAPLPVGTPDPVERLRAVAAATAGLKQSRQAVGAEVIASAQGFAPPTILAQASRLNFSARSYNLLVTNVPGPQVPLHLLGRRMRDVRPVPFLAGERALAVAVMSYDGTVSFGLLADLDAMPDLDVVAAGVRDALAQLVRLARAGA
jgi:WS/DGAT/MGAT family acyltransferase